MTRDTDRGTTVGDTRCESANVSSLVPTSKTHLVVLAIDSDVLRMPLGQLGNSFLDRFHATLLTHRLGGEVGVASSAIPITSQGLGVERDLDTPLLGNADEEVAGHPEMVTHINARARANLELPLRRHDLSVDTADVDTGVEAGAIVSLDQVTGENLASTYVMTGRSIN
jgi:hypothetical protein